MKKGITRSIYGKNLPEEPYNWFFEYIVRKGLKIRGWLLWAIEITRMLDEGRAVLVVKTD